MGGTAETWRSKTMPNANAIVTAAAKKPAKRKGRPRAKGSPPEPTVNVYEVLASVPIRVVNNVFGLTVHSTRHWTGRGCPRNADGSYNLSAVVQWRIDEIKAEASAPGADKQDADLRFRTAKATLAELKVAVEEGRLVPAAEATKWLGKAVEAAKQRLLALPTQTAPILTNKVNAREIEDVLRDRLTQIIADLANAKFGESEEEERGESNET